LCDEEEEGHDYPGFEGPVEIGAGIAQDEEGEDHEEVYYRGGVAFDVEDEVECIACGLGEGVS
jgi:hypothetical protein